MPDITDFIHKGNRYGVITAQGFPSPKQLDEFEEAGWAAFSIFPHPNGTHAVIYLKRLSH